MTDRPSELEVLEGLETCLYDQLGAAAHDLYERPTADRQRIHDDLESRLDAVYERIGVLLDEIEGIAAPVDRSAYEANLAYWIKACARAAERRRRP